MTQTDSGRPAPVEVRCLGPEGRVALSQFRQRRMVHAYLLTGARGLGKRTLARALAGALFCMSPDGPCGKCEPCLHLDQNPDVLTLYADDGKTIGVERVREVLRAVAQHSFGSGYRVVLIEPVERMTPQAQNCLLKALEEPAAQVVFLLMAHEPSAALGTIASRCARVKLTPWPDDLLRETLTGQGYDAQAVQEALPLAAGNIGLALELLNDSHQRGDVQAFVSEALGLSTDAAAVGLSTRLKEERDSAEEYLAALEQAIHRALLVRTGLLPPRAVEHLGQVWRWAAQNAPVAEINDLLCAVFDTRRRRAAQVNWQANLDRLMMKLLEEQTKWQQSLV